MTLVVLNMCSTQKLATQLSGRGANFVFGWPSAVPDGLAVDVGLAMIERLGASSVSAAFERARACVPSGERPPVLISMDSSSRVHQPSTVTTTDVLNVVLKYR